MTLLVQWLLDLWISVSCIKKKKKKESSISASLTLLGSATSCAPPSVTLLSWRTAGPGSSDFTMLLAHTYHGGDSGYIHVQAFFSRHLHHLLSLPNAHSTCRLLKYFCSSVRVPVSVNLLSSQFHSCVSFGDGDKVKFVRCYYVCLNILISFICCHKTAILKVRYCFQIWWFVKLTGKSSTLSAIAKTQEFFSAPCHHEHFQAIPYKCWWNYYGDMWCGFIFLSI